MNRLVLCSGVLCAVAGIGWADGKSAAASATTTILSTHMVPPNINGMTFVSPWMTALSTTITPPGGKDLFISFSAQTALLDLSGQGGSGLAGAATFTEEDNIIQARVLAKLVDGVAASPGGVVYDCLIRSLSTVLANQIASCHGVAETGVVTCTFGNDFISQIIDTTGVRTFNFIMRGVSPGTHVVQAQVRFVASNFRSPNAPPNQSVISAVVGSRTLTVEQVQLDQ